MFEVVIRIISLQNYYCGIFKKINYLNLVPELIFGVPAPIFLQKSTAAYAIFHIIPA